MSVRHDFGDTLRAAWAGIPALSRVDVVVSEKPLGDIRKPTALIRGRSIGPEPGAPLSHRRVVCLLTLVSPSGDLDKARDELDELTWAVLDYLDPTFVHDDAEAVGYGSRLLAVDIPVTVIAQKD
ncbi:hypothetical protein ACF044_05040 [Microbacterium sp. NPDC016588]